MIETINHIAEEWLAWQTAMLWQVAVLIAIVAAVDLLIRKWAWPQVRYALWLLVLLKLVLPPTLTLPTSLTARIPALVEKTVKVQCTQPPAATLPAPAIPYRFEPVFSAEAPVESAPINPPILTESPMPAAVTPHTTPLTSTTIAPEPPRVSLKVYALLAWLGGVVVLAGWLTGRLRRFRREHLKNYDKYALGDKFRALLEQTAAQLKLKKIPRVILTDKVKGPAVFGVFRPVLLMPADKVARLTSRDTEHILLHELAHIKRGDLFVHAVFMILQIAYWFNPLIWLTRKPLQSLRELCCDATVAKILKDKTSGYRETLLETARQLLAEPVTVGMGLLGLFENSHRLLDRLKWLEKKTWKNRPLRIALIGVLVGVMLSCVLPMAKAQNLTNHARKTMKLANRKAHELNHAYIGTEHILLALIGDNKGVAARILKNLDIDTEDVPVEISKLVKSGSTTVKKRRLPQTPRAKKVIPFAEEVAMSLNHDYVSTEHILLGLMRVKDGVAAQVLANLGAEYADVRRQVLKLVGPGPIKGGHPTLVISGIVKDAATGLPIAGAKVGDDGYADGKRNTVTESDGTYSFLTWPEHHSIKADADGYKPQRETLYKGHFDFKKETVEEVINFQLTPEDAAQEPPFTRTLADGVTVELLGVCDIPADGKRWWAADGSPVENVYWDGTSRTNEEKEKARQVVLRINSNETDPDLKPSMNLSVHRNLVGDGAGSWVGVFFVHEAKSNRTLGELSGCSFSLHDDHPTVDVSATVDFGPWKTQGTKSSNSYGDLNSIHTNIGTLIINDPTEKEGKTSVSATLLAQVKGWRIVAIDKQGKTHNGSSSFSIGLDKDAGANTPKHQLCTAQFALPLSQIEKFQFQTRETKTVIFKNVSLRPGVETKVEVAIDEGRLTNEEKTESPIAGETNEKALIRKTIGDFWKAVDSGDSAGLRSLADPVYFQNSLEKQAVKQGLNVPDLLKTGALKHKQRSGLEPGKIDQVVVYSSLESLAFTEYYGDHGGGIAGAYYLKKIPKDWLIFGFVDHNKVDGIGELLTEFRSEHDRWRYPERYKSKERLSGLNGFLSMYRQLHQQWPESMTELETINDNYVKHSFNFETADGTGHSVGGYPRFDPKRYPDFRVIKEQDRFPVNGSQAIVYDKTLYEKENPYKEQSDRGGNVLCSINNSVKDFEVFFVDIDTLKEHGIILTSNSKQNDTSHRPGVKTAVQVEGEKESPKAQAGSTLEFRLVADLTATQAEGLQGPDADPAGFKWLALMNRENNSWYKDLPHRRVKDTVYLLVTDQASQTMPADGTWGLDKSSVTHDNTGRPAVYVWFNESGSRQFLALTKRNIGRKLAICIDGKINSTPQIMMAISKRAVITGNFTEPRAEELADALRKGMSQKNTSPPGRIKTAVLLPSMHKVLDLSTGTIIDIPVEVKSSEECLKYAEQNCGCGIMFDHDGDLSHLGFINVLHVDRHTEIQSGIKMMSFVSKNMPQEVVVTASDGKRYRIQITKAENEGGHLSYHQLPGVKPEDVNPDFTATLPNGVTVELLGICEHPSEGKQWWRPDGSVLKVRPYDKLNDRDAYKDLRMFEVVYRLTSPGKSISTIIRTDETPGYFGPYGMERDIENAAPYAKNCVYALVPVIHGLDEVDIRIACGTEDNWQWHARVTSPVTKNGMNTDKVNLSVIAGEQGYAVANVTHRIFDKEIRVIAKDKSGKLYHPTSLKSKTLQWTAVVSAKFNIPADEIESVEVQSQEFQTATFKNVSLRPGGKGNVQIEIESEVKSGGVGIQDSSLGKSTSAEAAFIIQKVLDRYAGIKTYSAIGELLSDVDRPREAMGVMPGMTTKMLQLMGKQQLKSIFTIKMARPNLYCIEWNEHIGTGSSKVGNAWSIGDGSYALFLGKEKKFKDPLRALISAQDMGKVQSSLFFDTSLNRLRALRDLSQQQDGQLEGVDCYVISGSLHRVTYTYWVSKKDFLIRRYKSVSGGDGRPVEGGGHELTDETIKESLKAMDKEATPREIAKVRAILTAANETASKVKVTNTETYRNIILDRPISKEQFVPSKDIDEITEELKNLRAQYINRLKNISPTDPNFKTDVEIETKQEVDDNSDWKELVLPDMDSSDSPAMLALDTHELVAIHLDNDQASDAKWIRQMQQTPDRFYLFYEEASNKTGFIIGTAPAIFHFGRIDGEGSVPPEPVFQFFSKTLPDTVSMTAPDGQVYEFNVLQADSKSCRLRYRLRPGVKTDVQVGYEVNGTVFGAPAESWWEDYFARLKAAETEEEFDKILRSFGPPEKVPAGGVVVKLRGNSKGKPVAKETVTDQSGNYSFSSLELGRYSVSGEQTITSKRTGNTRKAFAESRSFEFYESSLHPRSRDIDLDLSDQYVSVTGRVIGAGGKPVAGAYVAGESAPVENGGVGETAEHTAAIRPQQIHGRSNADGYYELKGFKAASFFAVFRYLINTNKKARGAYKFFADINARAGNMVQSGNKPLRVPLAGEEQVYRARRLLEAYSQVVKRTGGKDYPENKQQVHPLAESKGDTLTGIEIVLDHKLENASLDIRLSLTVRGKNIEDYDASVRLLDPEKRNKGAIKDGHFNTGLCRIEDITPGNYIVEVSFNNSYPTVEKEVALAKNEHKEIAISARTDQQARIQISGKVIDKRTGQGVSAGDIYSTGGQKDRTVINKDGSFSKTLDRQYLWMCSLRLSNGSYRKFGIDSRIDEQVAKMLAVHVDPSHSKYKELADEDGDGVFCDGVDCVVCKVDGMGSVAVLKSPQENRQVDFEGYFADSAAGAEALDKLWADGKKDLRDADEIIDIVRNGLRNYKGSGNILRWIGNLFIWGKDPQNEKAVELMYHASGSPDRGLYGEAIYFGLSVTKNKTPEILQALTAVAMKTDDYYNVTGRILWGCRQQKTELMACLDPYLKSEDESVRQKARDVKDYFTDSKAFMAKRGEEHIESVRRQYAGQLDEIKEKLLNGDSQTRLDTINEINSKSIMSIVDDSFLDAFAACTKDSDPKVRTLAARMMGNKFVWSGKPQNPKAIEILIPLLKDPDRETRNAAIYFGLSTVSNPDKELVAKMLATILDDREINHYGRVIGGIRRNAQACDELLKEWMQQTNDTQKAVKAYEIYEDVLGKELDKELAERFAGQKSDAHQGLAAICFKQQPVTKDQLIEQFVKCLLDNDLIGKVMDFYIIENRQTAVAMFTSANLADRNAIKKALMEGPGFMTAGYMHGTIGPTGSGWWKTLYNFRKANERNRIDLPVKSVAN